MRVNSHNCTQHKIAFWCVVCMPKTFKSNLNKAKCAESALQTAHTF